MENKKDINEKHEQKLITKCILKGMTLKQIALELNYAKSTVSYKAKKLFKDFRANDRFEFCINVFAVIIKRYKDRITALEAEIEKYK